MGLFGFGKKPAPPSDGELWFAVAGKIASLLEALIQSDPKMLADPYARVMLRDDWSVYVAADKREPEKILGARDVTFYFMREDQAALSAWVNKLQNAAAPMFAQIATEEFAKRIVRTMQKNVQLT